MDRGRTSPPRGAVAPAGEGDKESAGAGAGAGKAGGRRSPSPPRRGKGGAGGLGNHPVQLVPPSVLAANSKEAAEMEAGKGPVTAVDMSEVRRNEKGGVLVTPEELRVAFELLDTEKMGSVTLAALRKRLGFFFPDMTPKEYRFLMNNRKEITLTDLEELLVPGLFAGGLLRQRRFDARRATRVAAVRHFIVDGVGDVRVAVPNGDILCGASLIIRGIQLDSVAEKEAGHIKVTTVRSLV